jgi:hypothetical protein
MGFSFYHRMGEGRAIVRLRLTGVAQPMQLRVFQ